jgi:regulation of enolase protein 1 (concanavalin A-like superfamily)
LTGRGEERIAVPNTRLVVRPKSVLLLLAVAVLAFTPATGAQSLPAGWSLSDVGRPPVAGTASQASGTFSISSRGWDVGGVSDQFTFVSRSSKGDVSIVARVDSLANTDPWSLAGLMVRQTMDPASKHLSVFVTPANGIVVRARATSRGDTVQMSLGAAAAPVWLRLDRRSSTVTASRSVDGTTWTSLATVKIPLNSGVVVGLAVAGHSTSTSVSASLSGVAINGLPVVTPVSGGNAAPAVSLTAPAGGSTFVAPATIGMTATAADSDGMVARVDFYSGTVKLGSDSSSPYTLSWGGVPSGSYQLKAVAVDNGGATATSNAITVTVGANTPPLVSLTAPLPGAAFAALTTINLAATASDPDGPVQQVDFYLGSVLLGTDTTSPYTFSWLSVPVGSYSLTAVARDKLGATTTSTASNITVGSTNLSKAVFVPAIVPGTIDYYLFEVYRSGSDPSLAAPVATQNLGVPAPVNGEIVADVRATISGLASGSYIATVSSISAAEGKLRSAPYAFQR